MNSLLLLYWQCRLIWYKPVISASKRSHKAASLPSPQAENLSKTFPAPLHVFHVSFSAWQCKSIAVVIITGFALSLTVVEFGVVSSKIRRVPSPQSDSLEEDSVKEVVLCLKNMYAVKNGGNISIHKARTIVCSPFLCLSFPSLLVWSVQMWKHTRATLTTL